MLQFVSPRVNILYPEYTRIKSSSIRCNVYMAEIEFQLGAIVNCMQVIHKIKSENTRWLICARQRRISPPLFLFVLTPFLNWTSEVHIQFYSKIFNYLNCQLVLVGLRTCFQNATYKTRCKVQQQLSQILKFHFTAFHFEGHLMSRIDREMDQRIITTNENGIKHHTWEQGINWNRPRNANVI